MKARRPGDRDEATIVTSTSNEASRARELQPKRGGWLRLMALIFSLSEHVANQASPHHAKKDPEPASPAVAAME